MTVGFYPCANRRTRLLPPAPAMPSRKRPADAAPDGAAAAAKKAGIVQLLEVIATHQMDPGLIEAVENDLTPALLEELRTEHPAAEWSYRSMWLRGLSRRAMNGHPFEDAVGHLAALSDDAGSHVAHLRKEMRVQAVLHHLRAKEMDWKAGKKALDRLFEKAGGKGKGRAGAKEADPQAAKMLGEVLEHAQQKHAKKVAQVLSRHSVDELQTQLNVHLDKVKASRKFEGPAEEVVKLDLDAVASSSGVPEGGDGDDFDEVPIEVEKILGHKVDDDTGKVKYHVQLGGWQGKIEANGSWHYADEPALAG